MSSFPISSLHLPVLSSSSRVRRPNPEPLNIPSPPAHEDPSSPALFIRFGVSRRQRLNYLKSLGIAVGSASSIAPIFAVVDYLKSKGFSDHHFWRLSSVRPAIFSSDIDRTLAPAFAFLADDLSATPDQARGLVLRCPDLLLRSVDYRLRPTLCFLQEELGLRSLRSPTNLNAHLLDTPVEKLASKIRFLERLGLPEVDAAGACARFPAIFGYSEEHNLRPKVDYLVHDMEKSAAKEVKRFPQYFAFSLDRRIKPRHLHLRERGIQLPLQRMLLWSDEQFYSRWR